jgi:hypothetical protein
MMRFCCGPIAVSILPDFRYGDPHPRRGQIASGGGKPERRQSSSVIARSRMRPRSSAAE